MPGYYKLVIQNKQKILLQESGLMQYSFKKDVLPIFQDLFKTTSNLIQATAISVGATIEYQVISQNVRGFADLQNINKKFQEKIDEADKLFKDAIPESVRGDVETLFGFTNPGAFMAKRLTESINTKNMDSFIPFWWFTKYLFSGKFFETDIKNFGELHTPMGSIKFNNIIWYQGWKNKKLIMGSMDIFKNNIHLLSKTNIEMFRNIKSIKQLEEKSAAFAFFMRTFKVYESYVAPITEFYDFCEKWQPGMIKMFENVSSYESENRKLQNMSSSDPNYEKQKKLVEQLLKSKNQLIDEFFKNLSESSGTILKHEMEYVPNIFKAIFGEEYYDSMIKPTAERAIDAGKYQVLSALGIGLNLPIEYINQFIDKINDSIPIGFPRIPRFPKVDLVGGNNDGGNNGGGNNDGGNNDGGNNGGGNNGGGNNDGGNNDGGNNGGGNNDGGNNGGGNNGGGNNGGGNNGGGNNNDEEEEDNIPLNNESYILKIKNNQKFLKEEKSNDKKNDQLSQSNISDNTAKIQQVSDEELEELRSLGLNKYSPNNAEEIIIKNLLNDKTISKFSKQWLELVKVTKQLKNKSYKIQKDVFLKMVDISMKYFDNIQSELKVALEDVNNAETDTSKKINSELNKKYKFEMTPQGFAKKLSYDFELLCNINTIYIGSYLINIQFMFEKNQIIYRFLKDHDVSEVRLLINNLRNNVSKKLLVDDKLIKRFESINKEISNLFGQNSRTFEIFNQTQKNLQKAVVDNQKGIYNFCDEYSAAVNDFEKLTENEKLNKLIDMITEFDLTLQVNMDNIYNNFLPALKNLKDNMNINLRNKKDALKKEFDALLIKMDLQSFDKIYTENKLKFDERYNECLKYTGLSKEGSKLYANLTELKKVQETYKQKITQISVDAVNAAEKSTQKIIPRDETTTKKSGKATLKINTNEINPVTVNNNEEEE